MGISIRAGRISAIKYAAGTASVVYQDKDASVTRDFPFLQEIYKMPAVGDMVIVLHMDTNTTRGLILGKYWTDNDKPAEGAAGLFRMELAPSKGTAYLKYSEGTATLLAAAILLSGGCTVNGSLTVNGNLTVNGSIAATGGITAGGDVSTSGSVTASGDVTAGGTSLKNHTHTDSLGGGTTTPN